MFLTNPFLHFHSSKMGIQSNSPKSQLVLEICSLSTLSISCSHRLHSSSTVNPHFIDWYRLLGVEEDADVDYIRKQYRKLALQLHPDKNKHPKAEIAFKLALEAYSCLSDCVKRRAFNLERWKNFCIECNRIPYVPCNSLKHQQQCNTTATTRSSLTRIKDMKERFKEEAKVMENCLKANAALRNQSPLFNPSEKLYLSSSHFRCGARRESPIFNPSDYLFEGYPHIRNPIYKKPEEVWYSRRQNSSNYAQSNSKYDSPIFENRSVRRIFESESACVSS